MFEKSVRSSPACTLAAVAVVQFMVSLDLSVVNVGLPTIAAGLDFSALGLTWVIHAYALSFGGLLLLGGKLGDRFGRTRLLLAGLAIFGLASLLGGLAQQPGHLIAGRALQGVGAAAAAPAALALLTSTFPGGAARVKAFGVWSATNAAGGAFGVLVGGILTEYAGWRWVMLVNIPMVAIAFALALTTTGGDRGASARGRPDVMGAILATAGMTALVFGVVRTDVHGWVSAPTIGTLTLAVMLLVAFGLVEKTTTRDPMLRLGLLTRPSVAGANAYNLFVGAAMASAFYFASLYLQRVLGAGPARAGIEFLPFALGVIVGSVLAVKAGHRVSARTLMIVGALVTAGGFAWFATIHPDGSFAVNVLGPSIMASVGFGLCLAPLVSTAPAGVDPRDAGTAAGLLNSSRQIGASVGLAVLGTVAATRTGPSQTPEALGHGYALGLGLCAALMLAAAIVATAVLPRGTRPPEATPHSDQGVGTHA